MNCRAGCAACCVVISISSPIPGMLQGKPAGTRCIQLTKNGRCSLFGESSRPNVCKQLQPSDEMCGQANAHAYRYLTWLEAATCPQASSAPGTVDCLPRNARLS